MHRQVLSRPESLPKAAATGGGAETDLHLGFWRNPKRFNVAITRAKALLVRPSAKALHWLHWRVLLWLWAIVVVGHSMVISCSITNITSDYLVQALSAGSSYWVQRLYCLAHQTARLIKWQLVRLPDICDDTEKLH